MSSTNDTPVDPTDMSDERNYFPENGEEGEYDFSKPPEKFGYPIHEMTDRDLMEEIVYQGRSLAAALSDFQKMKPGDMFKQLIGFGGK